jgi:hypothetical protein
VSKTTTFALVALVALSLASSAAATTVFSDDFSGEAPALTVTSLTNFNVSGNVDVVGAVNPYGISATSTVIDLDGTTGPGALTSKLSYAFNPGDTVDLSFVLGGAQRGSPSDEVYVALTFAGGASLSSLFGTGLYDYVSPTLGPFINLGSITAYATVPGSAPFTTSSLYFTAATSGTLNYTIGTTSSDNVGPLLDSVKLDISAGVPEPSTWALSIVGFGLAGGALRRRRMDAVAS